MYSFQKVFRDSINQKKEILISGSLNILEKMTDEMVSSFKSGSKILLCENELGVRTLNAPTLY